MTYYLSLWATIGTFYLILLTYQDFKNKMMVDDRHNYFMMGVTVGLYMIRRVNLLYVVGIILIIITLSMALKRFKALGEADIKTISWIFLGLSILNIWWLVYFLTFFMAISYS